MNRYQTALPRVPFAIAAGVMTALTFAVAAIVPAQSGSPTPEARALTGAKVVRLAPIEVRGGGAPIEVAISPARIDVVGARLPKAVAERIDPVVSKSGQRG